MSLRNFTYIAMTSNYDADYSDEWVLNSRATHHMMGNMSSYSDFSPYEGKDVIFIGDGTPLKLTHIGKIMIETECGIVRLNEVLCVFEIKKNLLSIRQFSFIIL